MIEFDEQKFRNAYADDPEAVTTLFTGGKAGKVSLGGFNSRLTVTGALPATALSASMASSRWVVSRSVAC